MDSLRRNRISRVLALIYISAILLYILAPNIIVMVMSFNSSKYFVFPPQSFTLKWFKQAVESSAWRRSFNNSLVLALFTAFSSTILGALTAIALYRSKSRSRNALISLFLSPLVMPQLLLGIAMLLFLGRVGLIGSILPLYFGHVLVTFPYVLRLILAALPGVSVSLEEAAYTLGADELTTITKITLPIIKTSLISSWMFAFILSFDNLMISLFLASARINTIPVKILETLEWQMDPTVAAVSSIFMVLSIGIMFILDRVVGLRFDTSFASRN